MRGQFRVVLTTLVNRVEVVVVVVVVVAVAVGIDVVRTRQRVVGLMRWLLTSQLLLRWTMT